MNTDWQDRPVREATVRALLMFRGFTPTEIDALPKRTVEMYLAALPTVLDLYHGH